MTPVSANAFALHVRSWPEPHGFAYHSEVGVAGSNPAMSLSGEMCSSAWLEHETRYRSRVRASLVQQGLGMEGRSGGVSPWRTLIGESATLHREEVAGSNPAG